MLVCEPVTGMGYMQWGQAIIEPLDWDCRIVIAIASASLSHSGSKQNSLQNERMLTLVPVPFN